MPQYGFDCKANANFRNFSAAWKIPEDEEEEEEIDTDVKMAKDNKESFRPLSHYQKKSLSQTSVMIKSNPRWRPYEIDDLNKAIESLDNT